MNAGLAVRRCEHGLKRKRQGWRVSAEKRRVCGDDGCLLWSVPGLLVSESSEGGVEAR